MIVSRNEKLQNYVNKIGANTQVICASFCFDTRGGDVIKYVNDSHSSDLNKLSQFVDSTIDNIQEAIIVKNKISLVQTDSFSIELIVWCSKPTGPFWVILASVNSNKKQIYSDAETISSKCVSEIYALDGSSWL